MSASEFFETTGASSSDSEAEESYFISMTDIMVGLLFIFIIMLMTFGLMLKNATFDYEIQQEELKQTRLYLETQREAAKIAQAEAEAAEKKAEKARDDANRAKAAAERTKQELDLALEGLREAQQKTRELEEKLKKLARIRIAAFNELRESVQDIRTDIETMRNLEGRRTQMLHEIQERLDRRGVRVVIREENGVLQLPDEVLFESNSSTLSDAGRVAVGHLADALDAVLPCYASLTGRRAEAPSNCPRGLGTDGLRLEAVFVEGHTDSDGSQDYNWNLSAQRAINTYRELEFASDSTTELRNDNGQYLFSVAGYGENRRVVVNEYTDAEKKQNRRIDLRFVMNLSHEDALNRVQQRLQKVMEEN